MIYSVSRFYFALGGCLPPATGHPPSVFHGCLSLRDFYKVVGFSLVSANGAGWKDSKNVGLIFGSKPDKQKKTREKRLFRRCKNSGQNEGFNTSNSGESENSSYLCSDPEDNLQRWGATRNVGAHGLEESSKQESPRVPVFISKHNRHYEKFQVRL